MPLSEQNNLPRTKHTQPLPLPTGAGPGPSLHEVVGRQTNPGPGLEDRIPQVREDSVGASRRLITKCLTQLFFKESKVTVGGHGDGRGLAYL